MRKLFIIFILFLHAASLLAQQWSVSPSVGVGAAMRGASDVGVANVEIDYAVTPLFHFGLLTEYEYESESFDTSAQRYSNVAFLVKTDLVQSFRKDALWSLYLDTGFGWGHHYTSAQVDHNYHTYVLGFDYRLYDENRRLAGIVRLGTSWRTHNEHIGMNVNYGRLIFTVGIAYTL